MPGPPPDDRDVLPGSPATTITLISGLLGLLVSLNATAYVVSLFFSAVALAALPMALSDRAGPRLVRAALLGGLAAVVALVLVLVPLLTGDEQRAERLDLPPQRTSLPRGPA